MLLANGAGSALSLVAKWVVGMVAGACGRAIISVAARAESHSASAAGILVRVPVGEELSDRTETKTRRRLGRHGVQMIVAAVNLLASAVEAVWLVALLAALDDEEDNHTDEEDATKGTNGNTGLDSSAGAAA